MRNCEGSGQVELATRFKYHFTDKFTQLSPNFLVLLILRIVDIIHSFSEVAIGRDQIVRSGGYGTRVNDTVYFAHVDKTNYAFS